MAKGRGSTGFGALSEPVEPKRIVTGYGALKKAFSQGEWEEWWL